MPELWRPVLGYEGQYEVSNLGNVRSLRFRNGKCDTARQTPLPIGGTSRHGYRQCKLAGRRRFIHNLVLEAFVGPRPPGTEGAHLNGQKADNRVENLAWKTHIENEADKVQHGTLLAGDRHPARLHPERMAHGARNAATKLTEAQAASILAESAAGASQRALARKNGVSQRTVQHLLRGTTWSHLQVRPLTERPEGDGLVATTPTRRRR